MPGMTVLENIMLGLPKKTALRHASTGAPIATRGRADRRARRGHGAARTRTSRAFDGRELADHHLPRAGPQGAADRHGRADGLACRRRRASGCSASSAICQSSGVAVLYVSHRLDEILDLCHRVTVFRDGRSVAELAGAGLTRQALVEAIVGGAIERVQKHELRRPRRRGRAVRARARAGRRKSTEISFDLRKGEVLGLGGLVGAGRSELVRLLFGADRPDGGAMTLEGRPFAPRSPAAGGAGRSGLRAGGTARRGTDPDQEPRLQCRPRQSRARSSSVRCCR